MLGNCYSINFISISICFDILHLIRKLIHYVVGKERVVLSNLVLILFICVTIVSICIRIICRQC